MPWPITTIRRGTTESTSDTGVMHITLRFGMLLNIVTGMCKYLIELLQLGHLYHQNTLLNEDTDLLENEYQ